MTLLDKFRNLFAPSLSCEQANAFIADYLDGRLDTSLRTRFDAHLHMCPSCQPFLEQYRKTIELVHEDGQIDVPSGLIEHTLNFLREHRIPGAQGTAS
jgi:Putative zinc-finger